MICEKGHRGQISYFRNGHLVFKPEYFGAKSSMLDLLPGTVIPLKPIEIVNMITAASALQPMYPAITTVMAGT